MGVIKKTRDALCIVDGENRLLMVNPGSIIALREIAISDHHT